MFNSLSGRLLILTTIFVMIAEVLIFVPSIARFREDYMMNRLERAQIASLALLADDMEQRLQLSNVNSNSVEDVKDDEDVKHILTFTPFFSVPKWGFGEGRQPFIDAGCPETRCAMTDNRSALPLADFDALLFHIRDMKDGR